MENMSQKTKHCSHITEFIKIQNIFALEVKYILMVVSNFPVFPLSGKIKIQIPLFPCGVPTLLTACALTFESVNQIPIT